MKSKLFSTARLKFISILFILIAGLFIYKLFDVQVLNAEYYQNEGDRQYATPAKNIFERGSIFFQKRDGSLVSAASQVSGFKVAIDNTKLKNADSVYEKINSVKEIDLDYFLNVTEDKKDSYEEILHNLSKEEADKINSFSIEGVSVFKEKWRFYPGQELASHTIGFVGYNGDTLEGRYGLEKKFDSVLKRSEDDPYINFFAEIFSDISEAFSGNQKSNGDLVTTIEPSTQAFLEKTLNRVVLDYEVDSAGGIIINPEDGSIYALSAWPHFNPNNFRTEKDHKVFSNPLVENVFEFGSVVKPLVMAGAIDMGVVTAETKYNDTGSVIVEKKQIFNFDKKGRGANTTMQDVLNQSLNTGMVFAYQKMGKEKLREYFYSYGIKEKTSIDLPNETRNLISNLESPREIEYANASFGQGIALTPMAMVRALSSLANGGYLVNPHVVERIKYKDGTEEVLEYQKVPTKLKKETTEEISRMLVTVMDKSLGGGKVKLPNYSVAVKTGTAQIADLENGGYYADRNMHSFFGYFPAYDPKFLVFLYAVNPKGSQYASTTWTDPFLDITKFLLNYYQVPPDR